MNKDAFGNIIFCGPNCPFCQQIGTKYADIDMEYEFKTSTQDVEMVLNKYGKYVAQTVKPAKSHKKAKESSFKDLYASLMSPDPVVEPEEGSATGPCAEHDDPWHPQCLNHSCCVGHSVITCQAKPEPIILHMEPESHDINWTEHHQNWPGRLRYIEARERDLSAPKSEREEATRLREARAAWESKMTIAQRLIQAQHDSDYHLGLTGHAPNDEDHDNHKCTKCGWRF